MGKTHRRTVIDGWIDRLIYDVLHPSVEGGREYYAVQRRVEELRLRRERDTEERERKYRKLAMALELYR